MGPPRHPPRYASFCFPCKRISLILIVSTRRLPAQSRTLTSAPSCSHLPLSHPSSSLPLCAFSRRSLGFLCSYRRRFYGVCTRRLAPHTPLWRTPHSGPRAPRGGEEQGEAERRSRRGEGEGALASEKTGRARDPRGQGQNAGAGKGGKKIEGLGGRGRRRGGGRARTLGAQRTLEPSEPGALFSPRSPGFSSPGFPRFLGFPPLLSPSSPAPSPPGFSAPCARASSARLPRAC